MLSAALCLAFCYTHAVLRDTSLVLQPRPIYALDILSALAIILVPRVQYIIPIPVRLRLNLGIPRTSTTAHRSFT